MNLLSTFLVLLAAAPAAVLGDVYMQSPRGANGRNCERNVNRNNANRLYDTQNNAKGGYAAGRAVGGPDVDVRKIYYYEGEKVPITWTAQHGGGAGTMSDGQIILQFASTDTLDPAGTFNAGAEIGTPRDGIPRDGNDAATDRIPENAADATATNVETRRFGMHESYAYYNRYSHTEREKGLFTADQNVNRNDARGTRQNPNGNRNGLEIPEERDYYPWSNPSPWSDIAVLDMKWSQGKQDFFQQNSHVKAKGLCVHPNMEDQQKFNQRDWPNNAADCNAVNGATWQPTLYNEDYEQGKGPIGPLPIIATLAPSDSNHLGGGEAYSNKAASVATARELCLMSAQTQATAAATCSNLLTMVACGNQPTKCAWMAGTCRVAQQYLATQKGRDKCLAGDVATGTFYDDQMRYFDDNEGETMTGSTFFWSIPFGIASAGTANTVLRMRYNLSSHDFPAYAAGNNYLDNRPFDAAPGVDSTYNCRGNTNQDGTACSAVSPVTQDPYVQVKPNSAAGGAGGNSILSLALNTNQYARTFQDRTFVFEVKARPAELQTATGNNIIVGLTVKGKRGNIVQTFPAVEYDFFPKNLVVDEGQQVHIQWTGSDYNPQRGCNNGEGGPPDCGANTNGNGCATLANAIQQAAQNSRADRTNLVPMTGSGGNFPATAKGIPGTQDLYDATVLMDASQQATRQAAGEEATFHPFASAWGGKTSGTQAAGDGVLWDLMYIGQEAELNDKFNVQCLSQDQLEDINNKNRRENHPQNCAKLNGKMHPYFDAGVVKIKTATGASATQGKSYSFFSSRNNNFSNRDQTMQICVRPAGTATNAAMTTATTPCAPKLATGSSMPDINYNPFVSASAAPGIGAPGIDGIIQDDGQQNAQPDPLVEETTAPIEKDNDSVGDGEKEACQARIMDFLAAIGLAGIIAIAFAVLFLGIMGTLVTQALWSRYHKKPNWQQQQGQKV